MKKTLATLAATVLPAFAMAAGTTTPTADASANANVGVTGNYNLGGNSVNLGGNSVDLGGNTVNVAGTQKITGSLDQTGIMNQTGTLNQTGTQTQIQNGGTQNQTLTGTANGGTVTQSPTITGTATAVGGNLTIEGNKRNTPPAYASTPTSFICADTPASGALSTQFFGVSINGGTTSSVCKDARDAHAVSVVFNTAGEGGNVGVAMLMNKNADVRDGVEVAISMEECVAGGKSRLVCAREAHQGFSAAKQVKVAPASVSFGN